MRAKVAIESLGCSKNLVDAEIMAGLLETNGFELTEDFKEANVIIVNTCGFIESAKEESINTSLELAKYKEYGELEFLIMTGCLAQRYAELMNNELPEVDAYVGTTSYDEIANIIKELYEKKSDKKLIFKEDLDKDFNENSPRITSTPTYMAYLKIAEGCDNKCTYCIIPKLRGKYRSRKMDEIIAEAKELVKSGVKELIVIAQDTSRYGLDLYGKKKLKELLKELAKIEELNWIRVHYLYPEMIDEELIKVFKEEEKVLNYFDIPIQHCNDRILKLMNRRTTKEDIIKKINLIRENLEDSTIRTSLIVGFPSETNEEFEELKQFVNDIKFDRLGVFAYSKEEDTPAYKLEGHMEEEIKEDRKNQIMLDQKYISLENNRKLIGKDLEILIEEQVAENEYCGRSKKDSCDIDNAIFVKTEKKLNIGEFYKVNIVDALEYDLMGEI
ncbi:30S ribosomal protein S12 methylthiotransferase RimO [Peptostreptococcaceae bacterium AGR-M142]